MWIAAALVGIAVGVSVEFSPGAMSRSLTFSTMTLLDRCVLFGLAFFLVLLVLVMIRYPISIAKNIAVHCFFFSSILFAQTIFQVADQWALYHYSALCNTLTAGFDAILVTAWALLLTNAGDVAIIRIRDRIKPETELQLLGQLAALNGILLRAARK